MGRLTIQGHCEGMGTTAMESCHGGQSEGSACNAARISGNFQLRGSGGEQRMESYQEETSGVRGGRGFWLNRSKRILAEDRPTLPGECRGGGT